ncbi:MAG: hypothetical protein Q7R87_02535 [Nanoarchaeota archaeon]|nr:hypothetical protein [Nanoarchaeota archaeon]
MFYPLLGWGVFWVTFILGIILFFTYKRLYTVFYLISMSLYIFTAGFMIDVFNFTKLGILSTLIFSALVFMLLGYYLSKVLNLEKEK